MTATAATAPLGIDDVTTFSLLVSVAAKMNVALHASCNNCRFHLLTTMPSHRQQKVLKPAQLLHLQALCVRGLILYCCPKTIESLECSF